jgi:hypothetical protein
MVGAGGLAEVLAVGQLFGEMKDRPQKIGKVFVLQQGGVFQEPHQEIPPLQEEILQRLQVRLSYLRPIFKSF